MKNYADRMWAREHYASDRKKKLPTSKQDQRLNKPLDFKPCGRAQLTVQSVRVSMLSTI